MAIEELIPSPDETKEAAVSISAAVAPQWANGDYNFLGKFARAKAQIFSGFYRVLRQLDADALPSKDSSEAALDKHADNFGLPSGGGANKYGRHVPIAATGLQGTIKGTSGSTVTAGDLLVGPDGVTVFQFRSDLSGNLAPTIPGVAPGTGQLTGIFDAVTPGLGGNLSAGANLTWSPTLAGIDAAVAITTGTQTGRDTEDSGVLYGRLRQRLQLPPKGGAPQDYAHGAEAWAENATDASGNPITNIRAYGYAGGYDGTGGVMVVITVNGSGLARIPTAQQLADITNYTRGTTTFAGKSPISHSYRAIAPFMDPLVTGLVIRCKVIPSLPSLAFDWESNNSPACEVFLWNGVSKLTLSTLARPSLKLAIDNGQKPRIFVDTRGAGGAPVGPVIPPMARVIAWNDTDVPGKTTLTLETPLPPTWQHPSVGDFIFSGQAAICDAEAGVPFSILTYVDNQGTSRVSGCQDPGDVWDDVVSVSGVNAAALNTVAGDGETPLLARCVANETKIGVGTDAPTEQDVQAPDNATFGPGLWFCTRIIVENG